MDESLPSILIVDDVEANLIGLEATLGTMSCEIVRATSGNEALKLLLKQEFALILLDVQMPEMDGFEVASYVRQHPQTKNIPIIFLTAMSQAEANELQGYGSGAVDYLLKPINPHILRGKVRVFLELESERRRLACEIESHRKTSDELRSANAVLRHFTHAASHDLREPLRAMGGFLDALDTEVAQTLAPEARHYLNRSRSACGRMSSLLDSLLTYAKLQRPREFTTVDMSAVAQRAVADLALRIAEKEASVEVAELPPAQGDEGRLYQLFLNLISNAIKFARPGERPRVRVYAEESDAPFPRYCVEDNGIGVAEQHQATIFGAFQRLHNRDKYEGSGLGLTICGEIVEQHRGKIWLVSAPDQGSRFCFTFGNVPAVEK
jgi:signal transduction histidine kinase